MNYQKITLLVFLLILLSNTSFGQWKGKFNFGTSYYEGNVSKFDLRSDGSISHRDSSFELSSFYKVIYSEASHVQNNEEYSGGIKFDYKPHNKLSPFLVLSAYQNEYKNIQLRLSGLLGLKYTYYETAKSDFSISAAGIYDAEQYVEEMDDKNKIRLSVRPKFKQKIGQSLSFQNITFYKLNVQETDDYIVESSFSLVNKITNKIALKLSYEIEYVNKPTKEGLEKTDQAMIASILIKF